MRSYTEILDYLYHALASYQEEGGSAIKTSLANILALCQHLGNPHVNLKTVHVAGTNGKGSTCHMLAAVLMTAGYKTGLYTSPHYLDFRERIRIDGQPISENTVVSFVDAHQDLFDLIRPSFFEMTVALAFSQFNLQKTDYAVIETGMGGRLDSTNIITPDISIITNIAFDHMRYLGNSLREIAIEKAGIIKPGVPVVIGQRDSAWHDEVALVCAEKKSTLRIASEEVQVRLIKATNDGMHVAIESDLSLPSSLEMPLRGNYQLENLATTLVALDELRKNAEAITKEAIIGGISDVRRLTGMRGRWEVLIERPLVVADGGHNPAGVKQILSSLSGISFQRFHVIVGFSADKQYREMLDVFPDSTRFHFCQASIRRGLPIRQLVDHAEKRGFDYRSYPEVRDAVIGALQMADPEDLVLITGSIFVVAEATPAVTSFDSD